MGSWKFKGFNILIFSHHFVGKGNLNILLQQEDMGDMGGMGGLGGLFNDPEMMAAFADPEVAAAFKDISANPANIMKYQNNPKVQYLKS